MTLTVAAGFPYSNGVGVSGNGGTTATPTLQTIGDLLLLTTRYDRGGANNVITGISGAGTTGWQPVTIDPGVQGTDQSGSHVEMWRGTVTAAGATTLTVAYTGGVIPTSGNIMMIELTGYTSWGVDVLSASNSISSAPTTITWPSLTATGKSPDEAYVGYAYDAGGAPSAGSTSSFTYFLGTGAPQTEMVYNLAATGGPWQPAAPCVAGAILTAAAIVYGIPAVPTLVRRPMLLGV